jgi:hypothetical protein
MNRHAKATDDSIHSVRRFRGVLYTRLFMDSPWHRYVARPRSRDSEKNNQEKGLYVRPYNVWIHLPKDLQGIYTILRLICRNIGIL